MPRRRSALAKRADPGWHHIERFSVKDLVWQSSTEGEFFAKNLGDHGRLEVEIGPGAGCFLLQAAGKFPQTTFLAVEYAGRFLKALRDQVLEKNLTNIQLICCDAKVFIQRCLPEESVNVFHIYFPDPWPKRSQQKRRFLNPQGLDLIASRLKNEGTLYFATDFQDYAESIDSLLQNQSSLKISEDKNSSYGAYGLQTHFGERFLKQGKPIFVRVCQKMAGRKLFIKGK